MHMIEQIEYKNLRLIHDFMFSKIFSNPQFAKELLEILLDMQIDEVIVETQVTISALEKSKNIKLDILVRVGDTYYNIEMQNSNNDDLIKRAIYYRHMIITHALKHGYSYESLPIINIIFICNFDLMKKGLSKYTFKNTCLECDDVELGKYGYDIFLTMHQHKKEKNVKLRNLLEYLHTQKPCDDFTHRLDVYLHQAREDELWKDDYMKFAVEIQKAETRGETRGEARGEARGKDIGKDIGKMNNSLKLAKKMLNSNDIESISDFVEIPIEYVQALSDGCSIETIMEQHFGEENL